jgi:succinate-semialdehyde dehydrogenase/glutarate-semialdehyde dehydrogenase
MSAGGFATIDPSNGNELERFAYMAPSEVDERLQAAHDAAREWRTRSLDERAALLRAVASALLRERDALAATAVREMGKPITQARAEVEKCAWCCTYYAENGAALLGDQPASSSASRSYVAFRPLGVVFAVMPWNFPFWQVFRAAVPAIMAGNAFVLKHASITTRCALEIERIFGDAGAPAGLFAAVILSNDATDDLISDARISAVTLTGSELAGVAVASAAGAALKKSVLELGGSDAFVVLGDADLDLAVKTAVTARFQNNGQSCIAAKRFIVEAPVYDEFLRRFAAAAGAQIVGDPMDDRTQIGPVARADLLDALDDQVRATATAGAQIATGGNSLERAGNFYEPTVVAGVRPGMRMFDEETFGPAAAVIRASDEADALHLANLSTFGLGGSVWTRDVARGEAFAARMECGLAFVNGMVASDPRLPFGGVKKSGYGRELAAFGIHEFVNVQTVWVGPATEQQAPASE